MASYNIEMNMLNSSGSYDILYPRTLGSQVSGTVSSATNANGVFGYNSLSSLKSALNVNPETIIVTGNRTGDAQTSFTIDIGYSKPIFMMYAWTIQGFGSMQPYPTYVKDDYSSDTNYKRYSYPSSGSVGRGFFTAINYNMTVSTNHFSHNNACFDFNIIVGKESTTSNSIIIGACLYGTKLIMASANYDSKFVSESQLNDNGNTYWYLFICLTN